MVDGSVLAGMGSGVPGIRAGAALAAREFADSVRRLCAVAAPVARGRGAGGAAEVLARAAVWAGGVGVADGPSAAGAADVPGIDGEVQRFEGGFGGTAPGEPRAGGDAVHDIVVGVWGVAGSVFGSDGCGDRDADREPPEA